MRFAVYPLTPELWPALEDLFGEQGPVRRCWCMYWRIGNDYCKRPHDANKAAFCELVKSGPPPGLLAFDGELAVGWCQLTPRDVLLLCAQGLSQTRRYIRTHYCGVGCSKARWSPRT